MSQAKYPITIRGALAIICVFFVGCSSDLYSKRISELHLKPIARVEIVKGILEFRYAENPALAFSVLSNMPENIRRNIILFLESMATAALISFAYLSRPRGLKVLIPITLIFSGAFGNLYGRFSQGYVVDMIHVHFKNQIEFPIFNLADSWIFIGVAILMLTGVIKKMLSPNHLTVQNK